MTWESGVLDQPSATVQETDGSAPAGTSSLRDDASAQKTADDAEASELEYQELLGKLPPEIGTMLMMAGVVGVLLPGPIGTPMLIAGAVVIWPKTFAPVERAFAKYCPALHREGVQQVKQYVIDLNRRFPSVV